MAHVLVNKEGTVVNTISYDGHSPYEEPNGLSVIEAGDDVVIGAIFKSGSFTNPTPSAPCLDCPDTTSSAKILADALVTKGVLTQAEIDAVATENGVVFFDK